jgi:uncharacterized membrane-anchored protein YhcB (DUF1043 family)
MPTPLLEKLTDYSPMRGKVSTPFGKKMGLWLRSRLVDFLLDRPVVQRISFFIALKYMEATMRGALVAFFVGLIIGTVAASFVLIGSKRREMKGLREEINQLGTGLRIARERVALLEADLEQARELCGRYKGAVDKMQLSTGKMLKSTNLLVELRDKKIRQLEKILVDNNLLPKSGENEGE